MLQTHTHTHTNTHTQTHTHTHTHFIINVWFFLWEKSNVSLMGIDPTYNGSSRGHCTTDHALCECEMQADQNSWL